MLKVTLFVKKSIKRAFSVLRQCMYDMYMLKYAPLIFFVFWHLLSASIGYINTETTSSNNQTLSCNKDLQSSFY